MTSNIGSLERNSLLVFDDVCISTVDSTLKLIANSHSSVIITTKSPTVKLILQKELSSLHVLQLKPFSLEESKELVARKAKVSALDARKLASIEDMLSSALANLPLSVNVYSSLLAVSLRKPERTKFDIFDKWLVIKNWEEVEGIFGDRLHVRGFTGVVHSARSYLQRYLVMFLLAKICLVDSEQVPWAILQNAKKRVFHRLTSQFRNKHVRRIAHGLREVLDWLFSETGDRMLALCRCELEELGLITWEQSTSTLHIHHLTLQIGCWKPIITSSESCCVLFHKVRHLTAEWE